MIPSDLQNLVIPLGHKEYLGIVKTKELLPIKVYFLKIDKLIEKLLAKCVACKVVRNKHYRPT